jgi:hypothetical protein
MPWNYPLLAATAAFLSHEAMRFLLQATLADPYSPSLFVTDYEEGFYFTIADFAFHWDHFGHSPTSYLLIDLDPP